MSQGVRCETPEEAVVEYTRIYDREVSRIKTAFEEALCGRWPKAKVRGFYPKISVKIYAPPENLDPAHAYGYCVHPGVYESTCTRPDIFSGYLQSQLRHIKDNHPDVFFHVTESEICIPYNYALGEDYVAVGTIPESDSFKIQRSFDLPNIVDGIKISPSIPDGRYPLLWYNGPSTDRSLNALKHYTGTSPGYFQPYIVFTNYADYIENFQAIARAHLKEPESEDKSPWLALVGPGNCVETNENFSNLPDRFNVVSGSLPSRMPQMPAYHMIREDGFGITIVNIGVGPSNAKTMTDAIAVLRPQTFLMVGHCAGLNISQKIGDYVIPNGYIVDKSIMQDIFGTDEYISIPELSEIHRALKDATTETLEKEGLDPKRSVRTGIVTTTANRNWEAPKDYEAYPALIKMLGRNRSIGLDMESGVIAANGFYHHVPYGASLCISDEPLHGKPKLPGLAKDFYNKRVKQQLEIVINAVHLIHATNGTLQSRKLRSDWEFVPVR